MSNWHLYRLQCDGFTMSSLRLQLQTSESTARFYEGTVLLQGSKSSGWNRTISLYIRTWGMCSTRWAIDQLYRTRFKPWRFLLHRLKLGHRKKTKTLFWSVLYVCNLSWRDCKNFNFKLSLTSTVEKTSKKDFTETFILALQWESLDWHLWKSLAWRRTSSCLCLQTKRRKWQYFIWRGFSCRCRCHKDDWISSPFSSDWQLPTPKVKTWV